MWLDDFTTGRTTAWWSAYSGVPRGLEGWARWNPANLTATDGLLALTTTLGADGVYESAGTSNSRALDAVPALNTPYGKWGIRYRIDPGTSIGHVILLYKKGGGWPPEIDIVEDAGGARQSAAVTVHWKDTSGQHAQKRLGVITHDFTQWTTLHFTLTPTRMSVDVDGVEVLAWDGRLADGTDVSALAMPADPLWLGVQTHRKTGTPTPSEPLPSMVVDWVAVWKPTP